MDHNPIANLWDVLVNRAVTFSHHLDHLVKNWITETNETTSHVIFFFVGTFFFWSGTITGESLYEIKLAYNLETDQ